jgi:hypothetical protein
MMVCAVNRYQLVSRADLQLEIVNRPCLESRTHSSSGLPNAARDIDMAFPFNKLPKAGFALEIDGRIKTEFDTREGAETGAIELKRRFPALQIRIYDAQTQSRDDIQA